MNYFEYQDLPKLDRSEINISTSQQLQSNSDVEQLKYGVKNYDYASFEKDAYITSHPKVLMPYNAKLGVVKKTTTDNSGQGELMLYFDLSGNSISFSGITVEFVNIPKRIMVFYYATDGAFQKSEIFYPTSKKEFFSFPAEATGIVHLGLYGTQKPHHFLGVTRVEFGRTAVFDATNLVDASVISHYDVDGSTLQYDVAELTIFTGENDSEYLFQKKQPIVYKDTDGKTLHKFYVENGENNDDATASLTAYDSISLLEDEYLGGIYGFSVSSVRNAPTITYKNLVDDILKGTGVEYEIDDSIKDMELTGYIPICTRRKALATLCKGTNTRVFKQGGKLLLNPMAERGSVTYKKKDVVENPNVISKNRVKKLSVLEHKYSKSTEYVDLYNWYLQQGDNTMQIIKFDRPVYYIKAYEVTGTDDFGEEVFDTSAGTTDKVVFYHAPISGGAEEGDDNVCNYCIIKSCNTSNKILIRGKEIIDDASNDIYYERKDVDSYTDYENIVVDDVTIMPVVDGVKEVAKTLFSIENQPKTEEFMIVETERPNLGYSVGTPMISIPIPMTVYDKSGNAETIDYKLKITDIEDDLSGVYRVVAK